MPEYLVQADGSLRQLWPRQERRHAGSVLSEDEWVEAIEATVRHYTSLKPVQGASFRADQILEHLVEIAKTDRQYAWWSAHAYAAMTPEAADMPQRLADAMNQRKKSE